MDEINTLVQERLKKLSLLRSALPAKESAGPYGNRFAVTHTLEELTSHFQEGKEVRVAGRLRAVRSHGKTIFGDLHDEKGKIQLYVKEDLVGEKAFELFSSKIDIGDILGVEGALFKTKTEEASLRVKTFQFLNEGCAVEVAGDLTSQDHHFFGSGHRSGADGSRD